MLWKQLIDVANGSFWDYKCQCTGFPVHIWVCGEWLELSEDDIRFLKLGGVPGCFELTKLSETYYSSPIVGEGSFLSHCSFPLVLMIVDIDFRHLVVYYHHGNNTLGISVRDHIDWELTQILSCLTYCCQVWLQHRTRELSTSKAGHLATLAGMKPQLSKINCP